MKLKTLTINFSSTDEFLGGVRDALSKGKNSKKQNESLSFDSIETLKKILTQNRLEILMAIARIKPASIYQLAKFLNREHPHVTKDCKALEMFGFISLAEVDSLKKQYTPKLSFEYDLIRVNAKMEEFFSISAKSNKMISKTIA
jgi:predicted transcriptional regulator